MFLERVKTYIKNNWLFLIIMLIGSAAIFLQMSQVILYADDYSVGIQSGNGIAGAFNDFIEHYMTWGGGYTPTLVKLLLDMGTIFWQAFLAIIIVVFVGLTVKLICYKNQKYKWLVALILWSCVFILSIWVSSESIYWLDGGIAYLFSMFESFLLFYFLYTRLFQKISKKYDYFLLPFVALFAGWNSAQGGLISVAISIILVFWKRFIKKEKIEKLYYISSIICLIGFLIFYFAPGNYARMDRFTEYANLNLIDKIKYRASGVTSIIFNSKIVEFTAAPLFVYLTISLTSLIELKNAKKEKSKKIKIIRYFCSVYSLLFVFGFTISAMQIPEISSFLGKFYQYPNLYTTDSSILISTIPYIVMILAVVTNIISAFFISKQYNSPLLFTTISTAYLAEFAMVMAPYSPLRTTIYTIAFLWISIASLISIANHDSINTFAATIMIFFIININLGITVTTCYIILHSILLRKISYITEIYIFIAFFSLLSMFNYKETFINYYHNRIVNDENISRILKTKQIYDTTGESPEILYLKQPANKLYGSTGLAGIDWVENAVRLYYGLPSNINLEYEEE